MDDLWRRAPRTVHGWRMRCRARVRTSMVTSFGMPILDEAAHEIEIGLGS